MRRCGLVFLSAPHTAYKLLLFCFFFLISYFIFFRPSFEPFEDQILPRVLFAKGNNSAQLKLGHDLKPYKSCP